MKKRVKLSASFVFAICSMVGGLQSMCSHAAPEALTALLDDRSVSSVGVLPPKDPSLVRVTKECKALLLAGQGKTPRILLKPQDRSQSVPLGDAHERAVSPCIRPFSVPPTDDGLASPAVLFAMGRLPEVDRRDASSPLARIFALSKKNHELFVAHLIDAKQARCILVDLKNGLIDKVESMVSFIEAKAATGKELELLFTDVPADYSAYLGVFLEELELISTLEQLEVLLNKAREYSKVMKSPSHLGVASDFRE